MSAHALHSKFVQNYHKQQRKKMESELDTISPQLQALLQEDPRWNRANRDVIFIIYTKPKTERGLAGPLFWANNFQRFYVEKFCTLFVDSSQVLDYLLLETDDNRDLAQLTEEQELDFLFNVDEGGDLNVYDVGKVGHDFSEIRRRMEELSLGTSTVTLINNVRSAFI